MLDGTVIIEFPGMTPGDMTVLRGCMVAVYDAITGELKPGITDLVLRFSAEGAGEAEAYELLKGNDGELITGPGGKPAEALFTYAIAGVAVRTQVPAGLAGLTALIA